MHIALLLASLPNKKGLNHWVQTFLSYAMWGLLLLLTVSVLNVDSALHLLTLCD